MKKRHMVIPIFVPHKGCPYDCIYCNQKTISGQIDEMTEEKMIEIVDSHLKSSDDSFNIEIGFYGGSFTGIERNQQIKHLKAANQYVKSGKVNGIRLSTRPDYINEEILYYLKKYNVNTIELGVQSLDDSVLKMSCRGHSADIVFKSSSLIKSFGFNLGIQTMIGLPGDSKEKDLYTARRIIDIAPSMVRIYPTLVIKDTYLEKLYLKGEYTPLKLDEAVEISACLLELYNQNSIKVIRIGLQTTERINKNSDITAGPFHPAFRQLVESRLILKKMEEQIISKKLSPNSRILITTGKTDVSNVVGQKGNNIRYLKEKYNFSDVRIQCTGKENSELTISSIDTGAKDIFRRKLK
ncbi:MAG: elongator complex protein 3 [Acetivibrionales bacterium]